MKDKNAICVIGSGYVGLVTAACFAESGNTVYSIDKDNKRIENLKKGISPIYEPGIEDLLKHNMKANRLIFSTSLSEHINKCTVVFIAVGTPPNEDGSADLSHVLSAAEEIAGLMDSYKIIVTKSTVPVGTGERIKEAVKSKTNIPFDVASNPEFLKEGSAIKDFMYPDRIVLGADSPKVEEAMKNLYHPFTLKGHRVVTMSIKSAELTKYAANCFLATKISFMNDIAQICEITGANVRDIRQGIGSDKRIGLDFLYSGLGYGGSCFPKDVKALIKLSDDIGHPSNLLKYVEEINKNQREDYVSKIIKHFNNNIKGLTFAVWGLAFKPNTDDMREAPSIDVINALLNKGAKINAFDPVAVNNAKLIFGDKINYCDSSYKAVEKADALLLLTEWLEFRHPDFDKLKELLNKPIIFDGRNIYEIDKMKELGFEYISIGYKE